MWNNGSTAPYMSRRAPGQFSPRVTGQGWGDAPPYEVSLTGGPVPYGSLADDSHRNLQRALRNNGTGVRASDSATPPRRPSPTFREESEVAPAPAARSGTTGQTHDAVPPLEDIRSTVRLNELSDKVLHLTRQNSDLQLKLGKLLEERNFWEEQRAIAQSVDRIAHSVAEPLREQVESSRGMARLRAAEEIAINSATEIATLRAQLKARDQEVEAREKEIMELKREVARLEAETKVTRNESDKSGDEVLLLRQANANLHAELSSLRLSYKKLQEENEDNANMATEMARHIRHLATEVEAFRGENQTLKRRVNRLKPTTEEFEEEDGERGRDTDRQRQQQGRKAASSSSPGSGTHSHDDAAEAVNQYSLSQKARQRYILQQERRALRETEIDLLNGNVDGYYSPMKPLKSPSQAVALASQTPTGHHNQQESASRYPAGTAGTGDKAAGRPVNYGEVGRMDPSVNRGVTSGNSSGVSSVHENNNVRELHLEEEAAAPEHHHENPNPSAQQPLMSGAVDATTFLPTSTAGPQQGQPTLVPRVHYDGRLPWDSYGKSSSPDLSAGSIQRRGMNPRTTYVPQKSGHALPDFVRTNPTPVEGRPVPLS
jgi:hypothetical protein